MASTGAVLEQLTVPADPKGYRQLVAFGRRHGAKLWAIEGTGSFGAGLTTLLLASSERVVEVERPQRSARRDGVKNDDVDAVRAARQALAGVGVSEPRSRGEREAIRVLLTTRAQAIEFRTRAIAALHALVVSAPGVLRERLGIGPVVAAQLVVSWSHPGRVRSEAAFAKLADVAPIEASSGTVVRHRLNRFGDRQPNRALHTIVMVRMRQDLETQQYVQRRVEQGKSIREVKRCLKRHVARQLFRQLEASRPPVDRT